MTTHILSGLMLRCSIYKLKLYTKLKSTVLLLTDIANRVYNETPLKYSSISTIYIHQLVLLVFLVKNSPSKKIKNVRRTRL